MGQEEPVKTSTDELAAFEDATRDFAGLALRSIEHVEVSLSQFRLLQVLSELGRSTSTQCARALGVVGSSVTRLADRLDASGHLVRGADPANRSLVTLELTDSGHRVVRQVITLRRREFSQVLDRLDPAERAMCAAVLQKLHHLLDNAETEDPRGQVPM